MAMLRRLFFPTPTAAVAGDQETQPATGAGQCGRTDMVAPELSTQAFTTAQHHAGLKIDYNALQHLHWSPRLQPERASEVSRAIRDVLDRAGLSCVLHRPDPDHDSFMQYAESCGLSDSDALSHFDAALRCWWELNTALYYVLSPAITLDGPLANSDMQLMQRFVCEEWRDGKGLYLWLMSINSDDTIGAQQNLRKRVDTAVLSPSADLDTLQAHCSDLLGNWGRIVGNDPAQPHSYVWRLLTSMPHEPAHTRVAQLRQ